MQLARVAEARRPSYYRRVIVRGGIPTSPGRSSGPFHLSRPLAAAVAERPFSWRPLSVISKDQLLDPASLTAVLEITQTLIRAPGKPIRIPGKALSLALDKTADGFKDIFCNAGHEELELELELRRDILAPSSPGVSLASFPQLDQNGSSGLVSQMVRQPASVEDVSQKMMGLPLLDSRQNLLGLVLISLSQSFTRRVVSAADKLSQISSSIIEGTVRTEQLLHEATTDGLTGLRNRRYFDQRIKEEFARSRRSQTNAGLSLLIIDIDHFKMINDTYGHTAGDQALAEFAGLLMQHVRDQVDLPMRYGGEEFAIILPETNRAGAQALAERIRASVEARKFKTGDGKTMPVTVSIGTSSLNQHLVPTDLIKEADSNLYTAKKKGRNRVV